MINMGSLPTFPSFPPNSFVNKSLSELFGSSIMDDALDSAGSDVESETSTISSSPTSSSFDDMDGDLMLAEAVLREKFAIMGIDLNGKLSSSQLTLSGEEDSDESEEEPLGRPPLVRSTSLKTGKTPPSTPRRKKFVRFADSLGLDLAAIRHILQDDLPQVPQSAYVDLKVPKDWIPNRGGGHPQAPQISKSTPEEQSQNSYNGTRTKPGAAQQPPWLATYQQQQRSTLIPEFIEPCVQKNFLDRVRSQRVCLENCQISSGAGGISVTSVVRVVNLFFEKQVVLRFSANEWSTWTDCLASYIPQSSDGWSDRFTATSQVSTATGGSLRRGQRILFAIKYTADNEEYWDNNMGLNYSLIYLL